MEPRPARQCIRSARIGTYSTEMTGDAGTIAHYLLQPANVARIRHAADLQMTNELQHRLGLDRFYRDGLTYEFSDSHGGKFGQAAIQSESGSAFHSRDHRELRLRSD